MDIVSKQRDTIEKRILTSIKEKMKDRKILAWAGIIFFYSSLVFVAGGIAHKEGIFGEVIKPAIDENIRLPFNYIRGLLSNPDRIAIDIKFKDYQKIARKREEALERGVLITAPDDWVPARIRWKDKDVLGEIRLKGDLSDHWERDRKWSLRIKVKGNDTILGMKVFSIQHPRTRGFMNDWYLQELCVRFAGLMRLQYDFIDVTINGENFGIYCVEEFFDDMLLVNNHHINSPIVKLYDALLWHNVVPGIGFYKSHLNEMYTISPVDAFRTKQVHSDNILLNNFLQARNLLESFRLGKLLTHQVFDADKMARLFAIMDLYGYQHSTAYSNMRLYYNPVTSLLEPIGYDETFIFQANRLEGQNKKLNLLASEDNDYIDYNEYDIWYHTFFKDRIFFEKYIKALDAISDRDFLDKFFVETEDESGRKHQILYKSFPGYRFPHKELLYKNQGVIRNLIDPVEAVQVYTKNYDNNMRMITLEVGNIQSLPVEILGVSIDNGALINSGGQILLDPKKQFEFIDFKQVSFRLPADPQWTETERGNIRLQYKILGSERVKSIQAYPWAHYDEDFPGKDFIRQQPNFRNFSFLKINEEKKSVFIESGVWKISKNLVIPKGYKVYCGPNTTIVVSKNAKILSYSPFQFIGSENAPISIESVDGQGQGIVILRTENKTIFEHVIFRKLSEPLQERWNVRGSVNFYEAPFLMKNCVFVDDRTHGGLNIIRSRFQVENVSFVNSNNDGVSVTHSNGEISNARFENNKGKGIHVSGSIVNLENVVMKNVSGIGISIDEKSRIRGGKIEIDNTYTAIESVDQSDTKLENVKLKECTYGIVVFQKRPEFGPSFTTVTNLIPDKLKFNHLVEEGSTLSVNGKEIRPNDDLDKALKFYRGKSG